MTGHRRAALVISLAALVFGIAGLVAARDLSMFEARGALVGSLMSFNPFGAIATIALAAVGLAGAGAGVRSLTTVSGAGFALAALIQLAQAGRASNLFGGRPSTFSFFLCIGVGLLVVGGSSAWRTSH